jgi:signal transduction histidine kinase
VASARIAQSVEQRIRNAQVAGSNPVPGSGFSALQRSLPSAVNTDLKAQLEETRSMVQQHIEEARKIQQALSEAASAAPPPAG